MISAETVIVMMTSNRKRQEDARLYLYTFWCMGILWQSYIGGVNVVFADFRMHKKRSAHCELC